MFDGELYPMTSPGDSWDDAVWGDDGFDDTVYWITELELADGWVADDRDSLPDIESIPPGPFLAVILSSVDRCKLNGYDLVRVLKARERLVSHHQAQSAADMMEISYSAPGDSKSPARRIEEAAEYASDEIRAALHLTRRSADTRLGDATDLRERLPQAWQLLDQGLIDWPKARVIAEGTCHLTETEAREVVSQVSDLAPHLPPDSSGPGSEDSVSTPTPNRPGNVTSMRWRHENCGSNPPSTAPQTSTCTTFPSPPPKRKDAGSTPT
jgi:hypothetical protein